MSALTPDPQASVAFLERWRPGGPWQLTAIKPDRQDIQTRMFDQSNSALEWLSQMVDSYNLYFTVNPLLRSLNKKAVREDVASLAWLHVDIDPRAGEDIDVERTRALEMLSTRLPDGVPRPTCVVYSGGGYQGFWRLEEPLPINGEEAKYEDAKLYNVQLEQIFGADHCHNVDRIMRLPGTINFPNKKKASKGRVPVVAAVEFFDDVAYPLGQFAKVAPVRLEASLGFGGSEARVSSSATRVPDVNELDKWNVPDRIKVIAVQGHHPDETKQCDNSRSAWVFDFCCNMHRFGVPDEVIYSMLTDKYYGISESVLENGRNARKYALRQIERAKAKLSSTPAVLSKHEPLLSARAFVTLRRPTLLYYNRDWLDYEDGAYRDLELDTVKAEVWAFLDAARTIRMENKVPIEEPFRPTKAKVGDVMEALGSETHVPRDTYAPPCWVSGDGPQPNELLACRNGLVHLPSGTLLPGTERFFTRNALDFDFDPTAPIPERWLNFLLELWPDATGEAQTLQEMFGYLLVPDTSQQKIFLLIGPKRSGKGTIGRVLRELVGQRNMCAPSLDELGNNFGLEPLLGKQLCVASDMRLGGKTDVAKLAENLLRLSGEDDVTVARKYKGAWTGRMSVRFVIMTNEMPSIGDASGALASRFVPMVMHKSFYGSEDTALTQKLQRELPGILNWAMLGWRRLAARGYFELPASSQEAVLDFENLSSPVKAFLRQVCEEAPDAEVAKEAVFAAWTRWCHANGMNAGNAARFSEQLIAATDRRVRASKLARNGAERLPHWVGLRLLHNHEPPF